MFIFLRLLTEREEREDKRRKRRSWEWSFPGWSEVEKILGNCKERGLSKKSLSTDRDVRDYYRGSSSSHRSTVEYRYGRSERDWIDYNNWPEKRTEDHLVRVKTGNRETNGKCSEMRERIRIKLGPRAGERTRPRVQNLQLTIFTKPTLTLPKLTINTILLQKCKLVRI